jgi:protein O-GlcNAc transferase
LSLSSAASSSRHRWEHGQLDFYDIFVLLHKPSSVVGTPWRFTVNIDQTFQRALAAFQAGRLQDAERLFKRLLDVQPSHVGALHLRGALLTQFGRFDEALTFFDRALKLRPDLVETWIGRGSAAFQLGRGDEAIIAFDKALALKPDFAPAWLGRGNALSELARYDEALAAYDKALARAPELAAAVWLGRGNVFLKGKRYEEALAAFDKTLTLAPDLAVAWLGRGNVLRDDKAYDSALAAYDKALALEPRLAIAWLGRGNVLAERKRYEAAFAAFDKALALAPDLAAAWLGRGNVSKDCKAYDAALADYDKALALDPNLAAAWLGRGSVFAELKRHDRAFAAYGRAVALEPDLTGAEGARLLAKMHLCDWSNLDAESAHLLTSFRNGVAAAAPFVLLTTTASSADQLQCAKTFGARFFPRGDQPLWRGERYHHDRIRVAYLSADLHDHPVAHLLAGVFERHDRSRFETVAVSFAPEQPSEMRTRLKGAFDRFIDARLEDDLEVARLLRAAEVDIAIDLMGHTQDSRTAILAYRPAPVQVSYLGYAGTLGANFIDYILADRTVIPEEQRNCYVEKVVYLPDTFMANDNKRQIAARTPSRAECGLPETGFVFCSFNNSFKITPATFDVWMRLLRQVNGSVLWLSSAGELAVQNLRRAAEARGVEPDRLIFAERIAQNEDHLARLRLADLFLDTLPYNAHATASDALWAGLPVVTCLGATFAGRVGGSLLRAVGLPELATSSREEYETLALRIAQDATFLASLKGRLQGNLRACPLFNTERFTRHLEAAYTAMWEISQQGELPVSFAVDSV